MFKALTGVLLIAGTSLGALSAHAGTIVFDDFEQAQGPIQDTTARMASCASPRFGGPGAVLSTTQNLVSGPATYTRRLSDNLCMKNPRRNTPTGSIAQIGSGQLNLSNLATDNSVFAIRYTGLAGLGAQLDAAFPDRSLITELAFQFKVVASDANPVSVQAILDGNDLGTQDIGANFTGDFNFDIDPTTDITGTLDLIFTGSKGYDIVIESLGLFVQTPEPATVALFGLGVLGLGAARRRTH